MNYLAHIFLSKSSENDLDTDLMLGNFLGDFIRSKELIQLPKRVQQGVLLHQAIDQYTDSHPAFKSVVLQLRPSLGKYAPVALDIVNDHLLSMNWNQYSDVSLREFCDLFYKKLMSSRHLLPNKLKGKVGIMLEHDFLMSSSTSDRLYRSLQHMDGRAKFESNFTAAQDILESNFLLFQDSFEKLIVDLISFSQTKTAGLSK